MTPLDLAIAWLCGAAILAGVVSLVFAGRDLTQREQDELYLVQGIGYGCTGLAVVLLVAREVTR